MSHSSLSSSRRRILQGLAAGGLGLLLPAPARAFAAVTGFRLAVAEAAAQSEALAAFYRGRNFEGIWTGDSAADIARRNALLGAFAGVRLHGLPEARFDPAALIATLQGAATVEAQGQAEVELSRLFLMYADHVGSGILDPLAQDAHIKREAPRRDGTELLRAFAEAEPMGFLRRLPPTAPEYARLMRERVALEQTIAAGGWGPAAGTGRLEPGDSGSAVVALRNRLVAMGYLAPTPTRSFDGRIEAAVMRFQAEHGLTPDGVAGESTLAQINIAPETRLQQVIVAMERERWSNGPRGERHIWVNLADFSAAIVDEDRVTFRTRAVIGAVDPDRQSLEFSDEMDHMVINPSWFVPRSIIVNEYLPALRRNPNAAGHLRITDSAGREISRGSVNFSRYNASNFPYAMHQPPSSSNALGLVKFMFPNAWNIYLHDTPAKDLFAHEVRAYSHGCIRLAEPQEFAHALLARQTDDPVGLFEGHLNTGAETRVNLEQPVPVHLDYRTAFTNVTGGLQFRGDIYGRDGRIWDALSAQGVEAGPLQG